jgi:hypothetical protein
MLSMRRKKTDVPFHVEVSACLRGSPARRASRAAPRTGCKVAATRLASRGGTTTQLKAVFGWKTSSEADLHTEAAEREHAARDAAEKLKK